MSEQCPLHHADVTTPPKNKERWAPPSPLIGMCFQLHDTVLLLYCVAHTRNDSTRKAGLLSVMQCIEANVQFIKDQINGL